MKILMVRHGETPWNVQGRFQGQTDIPLSEKGLQQAAEIAKALSETRIDVVYSSSLSRVLTTAKMISEFHHLEPIIDDSLLEMDFGEWDGHTHQELASLYPEQYAAFMKNPSCASVPGEGSMVRARIRVAPFLEELLKKYKGTDKTILLTGSSTILKLCIFHLLDLSTVCFDHFVIDNAAVTVLEEHGDQFALHLLNARPGMAKL